MYRLNQIKSLIDSKYSDINISEQSNTIALYYSECDSYVDTFRSLVNESFMIEDMDYEYIAEFLYELNQNNPIVIFLGNQELGEEAHETHYAYLKRLLTERGIKFHYDESTMSKENDNIIIDIISNQKSLEERISKSQYQNSIFLSFILERYTNEGKNDLPDKLHLTYEKNIKDWQLLNNRLPFNSLYQYTPIRHRTPSESKEIEGQRRFLWDFKDNSLLKSNNRIEDLDILSSEIEEVIYNLFECNNLPFITLFPIPTGDLAHKNIIHTISSGRDEERYLHRFAKLCDLICHKLNLDNGINYITFDTNDNFVLNIESLKGKTVILLDDIVTRGTTALRFKDILEGIGAKVLCLITISRTVR